MVAKEPRKNHSFFASRRFHLSCCLPPLSEDICSGQENSVATAEDGKDERGGRGRGGGEREREREREREKGEGREGEREEEEEEEESEEEEEESEESEESEGKQH